MGGVTHLEIPMRGIKMKEIMTIEEAEEELKKWCPFCCKYIKPSNFVEFENLEHDSLIYVHDKGVDHDEDYDFSFPNKKFH
jgi:hypothetical protein